MKETESDGTLTLEEQEQAKTLMLEMNQLFEGRKTLAVLTGMAGMLALAAKDSSDPDLMIEEFVQNVRLIMGQLADQPVIN